MLRQLRRHLIQLNTGLTSLILTISLCMACYMNCSQKISQRISQYDTLLRMITTKFSSEQIITNKWLCDFECDNDILLHIEDNGVPYSYRGSWSPNIERSKLFEHTQMLARTDGYAHDQLPILTQQMISSPVYRYDVSTASGSTKFSPWLITGTPVLSSVTLIPTSNGFISITMIQILGHIRGSIQRTVLLFLILDLLGILALYIAAKYLVGKALQPVIENQRKQTEFIAAASHDLRTPLAVIQNNASALLLPDADVTYFAPKIMDSCTHMSRLVTVLLSLAAADAKTWKLHLEEIDTEAFLIELYDTFSSYCQNKSHSLRLALPDDVLPTIVADKMRIQQILGILIDNAISYSPDHTEICIHSYLMKQSLFLEVIDHGQGVAPEERGEIFQRFYRSDKSRTDQKHFGIGLSIAKELIDLQKGQISVKDTEGGGATFVVSLPVH